MLVIGTSSRSAARDASRAITTMARMRSRRWREHHLGGHLAPRQRAREVAEDRTQGARVVGDAASGSIVTTNGAPEPG